MDDFEKIYATMTGEAIEDDRVDWVENLFTEGTPYEQVFQDFWAAREHLCQRFGMDWEDEDLERIMDGILRIEWIVGENMFRYGAEYAKRGYQL